MRHWASLLLLAVAALGAVVFFVRFVTGDNSPYYTATVERGDIVPLVSERGVVRSTGELTVRARIDGMVTWVIDGADAEVKTGTLLARIDPGDLSNPLAERRASLEAANAALESAEISARETASRLARFESVWRRSQGRVPSLNELEGARAGSARARLAVQNAQALQKAARLRLIEVETKARGIEVRAPGPGIVAIRHARSGQPVHFDQPLLTLAPTKGEMTIEVPLPAVSPESLKAGTEARLRFDANPDAVLPARLARVRVPMPAGSGPPRAVFVVTAPASHIRPGMPATVEMNLQRRSGVLLVPDAALAFEPGDARGATARRQRIYVMSRDGEPKRIYVTTGGSDGRRTEVFATGIRPGDQVITGWRNAASAS
jgi:RND family efflux transporter, MFP subunit